MAKHIEVDLASQTLYAFDGTTLVYTFNCVSGDSNHPTSPGAHRVYRKHRVYRSKKYDAQMDYAMFYYGGEAIHQAFAVTTMSYIRSIMRRVGAADVDPFGSHGCVRLSEENARTLFDWTPMHTKVGVHLNYAPPR